MVAIALFACLAQEVATIPAWVPGTVEELKQSCLLVGCPDGLGCRRGELTAQELLQEKRYQYAASSYAVYVKLAELDTVTRKKLSPDVFNGALRVTREFWPELRNIGINEESTPAYSQMILDLSRWEVASNLFQLQTAPGRTTPRY